LGKFVNDVGKKRSGPMYNHQTGNAQKAEKKGGGQVIWKKMMFLGAPLKQEKRRVARVLQGAGGKVVGKKSKTSLENKTSAGKKGD